MRPVYQTRFGEPDGNCLEACIASIFELDEIPWFGRRADWYDNYQDFMAEFGLQVLTVEIEPVKELWTPTGYHIISGTGLRGIEHSVVGRAGRAIHDPYPGGGFLAKEKNWDVFVARDPLLMKLQISRGRT